MRRTDTEVGLRLSCIVRPTRREAIDAARALLETPSARRRRASETSFVKGSDAESMRRTYDLGEQEWLTPRLWSGAVQTLGATSIAFLGTPEEVADEIWRFRNAGISQFILHGWPKREEMLNFCREVLPLVRQRERSPPRASRPRRKWAAFSSQRHARMAWRFRTYDDTCARNQAAGSGKHSPLRAGWRHLPVPIIPPSDLKTFQDGFHDLELRGGGAQIHGLSTCFSMGLETDYNAAATRCGRGSDRAGVGDRIDPAALQVSARPCCSLAPGWCIFRLV